MWSIEADFTRTMSSSVDGAVRITSVASRTEKSSVAFGAAVVSNAICLCRAVVGASEWGASWARVAGVADVAAVVTNAAFS